MGFALWIRSDVAFAQGTHEYKPMGTAAIAVTDLFRLIDFQAARKAPESQDARFVGFFASVVDLNEYMARKRGRGQTRRPPGFL